MRAKLLFLSLVATSFVPVVSYAATVQSLIQDVGNIVSSLIPITIGIALLVFFFGIIKFIANAGNSEGQKEGKQFIIWGILSLFVMVGIWGIIALLGNTFGVGVGGSVNPPQVNCDYITTVTGEPCP